MVDLTQSLQRIIETTIPILLFLWAQKRKAKKETERRYEDAKRENDRRHEENKERLDELLDERQYLRPHDHQEQNGPLMAEGVVRRRKLL
jgi:hypothetical protein